MVIRDPLRGLFEPHNPEAPFKLSRQPKRDWAHVIVSAAATVIAVGIAATVVYVTARVHPWPSR